MKKKRITLLSCVALSLSATAQTNLPFVETFDTEESMNRFSVVDNNEDGITWKYDNSLHLVRYDYNDYKAGDDWLFLPTIHFEKNKQYRISFSTQCRSMSAIESVEVTIGKKTDISEQKAIAEKLNVVWISPKETEYIFTVDETGDYNLAFHEVSAAAKYYLLLDDIKVSEVVNAAVPETVKDISILPEGKGGLSVNISFEAPSKDINGEILKDISSIEVYRDDLKKNIKVFENPAPSEKLSFTDNVDKSGSYSYKFTVNNAGGSSESLTQEVYVGYDIPTGVSDVKASAEGKNVKLTWEAPAKGKHGGYVDIDNLSYVITRVNETEPFATVKTTEFTDENVNYDIAQQALSMYTIKALNNGIEGEEAKSNLVLSGEPYKAPFDESFAYASTELYPWYSENTYKGTEKYWDLRTYGFSPQTYAYDDDAGLLLFRSYSAPKGTQEYFLSPLFDISDMLHPIFVYHIYHSGNSNDLDNVTLEFAKDGGEFKIYGTPAVLGAEEVGWKEYYVELDNLLKSKYIQLGIRGHAEGGHNIHIDKLALIDNCYDVMPTKPVIGSDVTINTYFPVSTTVTNTGNKTVKDIEVKLLRNGEAVQTQHIDALEPASEKEITFTVKEDVNAAGTDILYAIQTTSAEDEKTWNDISEGSNVKVLVPQLPTASNLTVNSDGRNVVLTWNKAEEYNNYLPQTDDFESYTAFSIDNIAPWTLVDADKEATGDWYIKYDNVNKPMAFQVFNTEKAELSSSDLEAFEAHSGKQYLISFFNDNYTIANDDWLVSPEIVSDKPVSFFAKTLSRGYKAEAIEVYYSEKTTDISDFKLIASETIPYAWTEFSYRLPASAHYFAIRHTSLDGSALMIDDITCAQKSQEPKKELPVGYNIYRDDILQNETPIELCQYTDKTASKGIHTYKVTAVFDAGESYYTDPVEIDINTSSIKTVSDKDAEISFINGRLAISGKIKGGVSIYNINGALVDSYVNTISKTLAKGTYILKYNGKTIKAINK